MLGDSYVHENGRYGVSTGPLVGALIDNIEMPFNNTPHLDPNNDVSGSKFVGSRGGSYNFVRRNSWVHDIFGNGIWFDGNNHGAPIENNLVENNKVLAGTEPAGINYEPLLERNPSAATPFGTRVTHHQLLLQLGPDLRHRGEPGTVDGIHVYGNAVTSNNGTIGICVRTAGRNAAPPSPTNADLHTSTSTTTSPR